MNTEPEPEFDYQAYMRNVPPRGSKDEEETLRINFGIEARQKRRETSIRRATPSVIATTVAQFHDLLEGLDTGKKPFLYRGQSDSHEPVNCSAVRRLTAFAGRQIEDKLIDNLLIGYLEYLISKARRRGFIPSDLGQPTADLQDLELLALLQHQGAATGLIDFTRQPLAALWFACNEASAKDGAVYLLSESEVAEIKTKDRLKQKLESFYGKNQLWSWEPPALGNRIVAQSSIFVFGVSAIPGTMMQKLTIPAAHKTKILGKLETVYGISEEDLFPDFSGYAVANSSKKAFDVNRTIDFWKEQIESARDNREKALAHFRCGVAYSAIREREGALKHYDEVTHIAPKLGPAYYNKGIAKNALGRYEEAIEEFSRSIDFNSKDAAAYSSRAIAKGELGRYEESIEDCDRALEIDPHHVEAFCNRGISKNELGRHEEAIEDFNTALRINSQYVTAYYNRGYVHHTLGQYEKAILDYDMAALIDPKHTAVRIYRGITRDMLGHHEEAISDYDETIRIDPQNAAAFMRRGYANNELGRFSEAIADCDEAIAIDPQIAAAYQNRGYAKNKLGSHEAAIADYDEAIRLDPQDAEAYTDRGDAKAALGRYYEAMADYDEALRIDLQFARAIRSREAAKDKLDQTSRA